MTTPGAAIEWAASDGRRGALTGKGKLRLTKAALAKVPAQPAPANGANTPASKKKLVSVANSAAAGGGGDFLGALWSAFPDANAAEDDQKQDAPNPHGFTEEQDKDLMRLKTENVGQSWAKIGETVGKSGDHCKERFNQIKPKDWKPANVQGKGKNKGGGEGGKKNKGQGQNQNQQGGQKNEEKKQDTSGPSCSWANNDNTWNNDNNNNNGGSGADAGLGNDSWGNLGGDGKDGGGDGDGNNNGGVGGRNDTWNNNNDAFGGGKDTWGNNDGKESKEEKSSNAGNNPGGWDTTGGSGWGNTGGGANNDWNAGDKGGGIGAADFNSGWGNDQNNKSADNGWNNTGGGGWGTPAPASKPASKAGLKHSHKQSSHSHSSEKKSKHGSVAGSHHHPHSHGREPLEYKVAPDDTFSQQELRLVARILQQDCGMVWDRVAWRFRDKTGRNLHPDVFEKKITGRLEKEKRRR